MAWDAVGIGVAVRDLTVLLESFPVPDSKVEARAFVESTGGPVPTALRTLSHFGNRTALVSVVGDDRAGEFIREDLHRSGVDTSAVEVRCGSTSSTSVILVEKGRRTVCEWRQAELDVELDLKRGQFSLFEGASLLLLDARLPRLQTAAARRAREGGALVILDCGHPRPGVEALLPLADVAIFSHSYPTALYGRGFDAESFLAELVARLPREGRRIAGLTLGAEGCVLNVAGVVRAVPGYPVEPVDTTGAGDVFHGAFAHALLRGETPCGAARFANAAAAIKCRALTGAAPLPSEAEVLRLAAGASG